MQKREKIIAVVMGVLILFWLTSLLQKSPKRQTSRPAAKGQREKMAKKEMPKAAMPARSVDPQRLVEQAKLAATEPEISSLKDPFKKQEPGAVVSGSSDLVLSGIIRERDEPIALINNRPLKEGDSISGFTIEKITQNEVVLTKGIERRVIEFPRDVKKGGNE